MARLIDANALLLHKRKMIGADFGGEFWDEAVLASDIKNAPTVDAVEVVRCNDCAKRGKGDCPMEQDYPWISSDADGFCSYGERIVKQ